MYVAPGYISSGTGNKQVILQGVFPVFPANKQVFLVEGFGLIFKKRTPAPGNKQVLAQRGI